MIELKAIKRIQSEYRELLLQYKDRINSDRLTHMDIRILLEHIQLFWYRYDDLVKFILESIETDDLVSFLAGAVRLDIKNGGAYEFGIMGKYHIINDPFVKMATYFKVADEFESPINMKYITKYVKESLADTINLVENYNDDFWVFPLNEVLEESHNLFIGELLKTADELILSMFESGYESIDALLNSGDSFSDIECKLKPGAISYLIYESFEESELSLEKRITRYIKNQNIIKEFGENSGDIFYKVTLGNVMQILDIVNIVMAYNLIPFFRQDVSFNYFQLMISNLGEKIPTKFVNETVIGFILQKVNFELNGVKDYWEFKEKAMDHKLMDFMLVFVDAKGKNAIDIGIEPIIRCAEKFNEVCN